MAIKTYLGNPNLKASGIVIEYTPDMAEEYIKCAKDPHYFISKYVKIVHVDRGLIPFDMYGYQKNMVEKFTNDRFVICKLPRQTGKSTTVTSFILWKILFFDNQNIAILANKGPLARDMLSKIQLAYEHLPKWIQQGVVTWNKGSIELENGSKVLASATSSSAVRGGSYTLIMLDEFAFVPRNIADNFFSSVYPTISSGKTTQIIIVSTPYGLNHFYKMWSDAISKRSDYTPIEVHWRETPGRDDKWKEETIRNTSMEQWRVEFETEFVGSTNTLINSAKLRALAFVTPNRDKQGCDIYEPPQVNHSYVISVDTARGLELDSSAFSVMDVTSIPYKQVAKFSSNTIPVTLYPDLIAKYGKWYNSAMVIVESNDVGQQVVESLYSELEYENVLSTTSKARSGQRLGSGFGSASSLGLKMTKSVKRIGCSNLKDLVEGDKLITTDYDTINELSTFISTKNTYQAEDGCHDDIVMTLVIFSWLTKQPYFKDLTNTDVRKKLLEDQRALIGEDLLPAGFLDDGIAEPVNLNNTIDTDDTAWLR